MVYVLCEGETGKSEYTFVDKMIKFYSNGFAYRIEGADGKENIEKKLNELSDSVVGGDKVALFFDNIERFQNIEVWDLLTNYTEIFFSKNVTFYHSTYYCFEEIFLSYNGILSLISQDTVVQKEIQEIQYDLMNGDNYYKVKDIKNNIAHWKALFPSIVDPDTREQFSASLLGNLLRKHLHTFNVTKKEIGSCWINDCSSLSEKIKYKCQRCNYHCKNKTYAEKLKDLELNSVLGFDEPVSVLFE